jgi:hypothetical protein
MKTPGGADFEHISKVLRPHDEASIPIHVRLAGEISRGVGNKRRLGRIVDENYDYLLAAKGRRSPCRA